MRFECEQMWMCFHFIVCVVIRCLSGCNHVMWGHAMITDVNLYICQATQCGLFFSYVCIIHNKLCRAVRRIAIKIVQSNSNRILWGSVSLSLSLSVFHSPFISRRCVQPKIKPKMTEGFSLIQALLSHLCLACANKTHTHTPTHTPI